MKIRTFSLTILLLGATGVASADQDDGHRGVGKFHANVGMSHERIHIGASPTLPHRYHRQMLSIRGRGFHTSPHISPGRRVYGR